LERQLDHEGILHLDVPTVLSMQFLASKPFFSLGPAA